MHIHPLLAPHAHLLMQVRETLVDYAEIDRLSFATWFKNRNRTQMQPPEVRKQLREEERKAKVGGGEEDEEDGGLDPEIAAAMGFGGFK